MAEAIAMEATEVRWLDELHTCMSHIAVMFEVCSHRESFAYIIHACMHVRSRPGDSRSRSRDAQPRPPPMGCLHPGFPDPRPSFGGFHAVSNLVAFNRGLPGPPPGPPPARLQKTFKAPMCPPPTAQVPPSTKPKPQVIPAKPGPPPGPPPGRLVGGLPMGLMEQQAAERLKDARLEANARIDDARTAMEEARRVFREEVAEGRLKKAAVDAEEAAALEEARVLCILQMRCYVVF